MTFPSLKTTRVLLVAGIGLAVAIVAAVMLALAFKNGSHGLAARLLPERTLAYIRTTDRTELLRWTIRLEDLAQGPRTKDFPKGDLYELAYLKKATGSGSSWVLYTHDLAKGSHHTLVSDADPSLFLPLEKESASLFQTYFFTQYVSRLSTEVVWLRPDALPVMDASARSVLQASLFRGKQILLLPQGNGRGKMIVDGNLTLGGGQAPAVLKKLPGDLLWVSVTDIGTLAKEFDTTLSGIDAKLATGLRGIAAAWVMAQNIEDQPGLWSSPLSLAVRRGSGSSVVILATSSLDRKSDVASLKTTLAAEGAKGTVRTLKLVENVRNDVIAEREAATEAVGDWTVTDLGGAPELFFAERGRDIVISTDRQELLSLLATDSPALPSRAPLTMSMNLGYAYGQLQSSLPFLGEPLKTTFQRLFGLGIVRVELEAESLSPVLVFNWTLSSGTPMKGGSAK